MFVSCVKIFDMEQRAVIKFCFKLRKTAKEVYEDPKDVYGDDSLSRAQVFRRFARFQEGSESLEDDPRPGRAVSARSNENVRKFAPLLCRTTSVHSRIPRRRLEKFT